MPRLIFTHCSMNSHCLLCLAPSGHSSKCGYNIFFLNSSPSPDLPESLALCLPSTWNLSRTQHMTLKQNYIVGCLVTSLLRDKHLLYCLLPLTPGRAATLATDALQEAAEASDWTLQSVNSYGVFQLNTDGRTTLQLYNIVGAGKHNINVLQRQLLTRSWKSVISPSTFPRGKVVNTIFNLWAAFKVSKYWIGNSLLRDQAWWAEFGTGSHRMEGEPAPTSCLLISTWALAHLYTGTRA